MDLTGPDHLDVAASLNNLAGPMTQKLARPGASDIATSLNNLALLYDNQGRYAKALLLISRAPTIMASPLYANGARLMPSS